MLPLFEQAILIGEFGSQAVKKDEAQAIHAKLSRAIVKAMGSLTAADATLVGRVDQDLKTFANTMAEVVLGSSVILRLNRDLPEAQKESLKTFADALVRVSGTIDESRLEVAIGKLAEVLLPDALEEARGVIAADNLELRDRFVHEVPQLTSIEISRKSGAGAKNEYATAARWKKSGDIFSVQHRGKEFYPAFQLQDGRPHPAVRAVLVALPPSMTAWQKAFWFVSSNGWLEDKAPVNLLDDQNALVDAAMREHEEVIG